MKRCFLVLTTGGLFFFAPALRAIDVNASKDNVPEKFRNPNTGRFDIFAGDPKRIQRANQIDFSKLEAKVTVEPPQISAVKAQGDVKERPTLKVTFLVKNNELKRTVTLSFPDAQRFDLLIKDPNGQALYVWSADKKFAQIMGDSRINPGERDSYFIDLDLSDIPAVMNPGKYTFEAVLANYPEITGKGEFTVN
jgi:Intracellular proteinase inhibitor